MPPPLPRAVMAPPPLPLMRAGAQTDGRDAVPPPLPNSGYDRDGRKMCQQYTAHL